MAREEETLIGTAPARLTRREFGGGLVAAVAVLGTGCAAISPSEERKLGEEAAEEVERTVGLVSDPRLVGYVRQVASRIAAAAKRPDVTWEFNVTDDIEPNAFALWRVCADVPVRGFHAAAAPRAPPGPHAAAPRA